MPTKTFPKAVQGAVAKFLPELTFLPGESDGSIQTFARQLGKDAANLSQRIDFQKSSGDWIYINFWITYNGPGKGGTRVDYTRSCGDRLDLDTKSG